MVEAVLQDRLTAKVAARQSGLSERSVRKWIARYRREGLTGLRDRSSRPQRSPKQTPPAQVAVVLALRRLRLPGFQIARQTGLSKATVSRLLRRHQLHRLALLDPPPPVCRYEREHPGELIHLDIKSWLGSSGPVTASPAIDVIWSEAPASSMSMSPSMTLPGSLSPGSCR